MKVECHRGPDSLKGKPGLTQSRGVPFRAMQQSSRYAISAELAEILCDDLNVDVNRIDRRSQLITDAGFDWTAFALIVVTVEDKLRVRLTELDLLNVNTIGDLDDLLHARCLINSLPEGT